MMQYDYHFVEYHPLEKIVIPYWRYRPLKQPTVAWNPWTDMRLRDDIKELNVSFPFGSIPGKLNLT